MMRPKERMCEILELL